MRRLILKLLAQHFPLDAWSEESTDAELAAVLERAIKSTEQVHVAAVSARNAWIVQMATAAGVTIDATRTGPEDAVEAVCANLRASAHRVDAAKLPPPVIGQQAVVEDRQGRRHFVEVFDDGAWSVEQGEEVADYVGSVRAYWLLPQTPANHVGA